MAFDVEDMFHFCQKSVVGFARDHQDETFYAFAIDADMLCLNSEQCFAATLHGYQASWRRRTRPISIFDEMTDEDWRDEEFAVRTAVEFDGLDRSDEPAVLLLVNARRDELRERGCHYQTEMGMAELRGNTGDWAYQGFADLNENSGFDSELYSEHYCEAGAVETGEAPGTDYAKAMDALVIRLRESDIFRQLQVTSDFRVEWVDHDY